MPGMFLRHRLHRNPLVSDPGMHHGTCVTHVPWCMSGSLTRGWRGKRSRHSRRMRNPHFYVSGKRPMRTVLWFLFNLADNDYWQAHKWTNSLQWRHNGHDSVSNHQPHDCFLNCYSDTDQRKHQSSASPHKWYVTRKMFPFDDVIMDGLFWSQMAHCWLVILLYLSRPLTELLPLSYVAYLLKYLQSVWHNDNLWFTFSGRHLHWVVTETWRGSTRLKAFLVMMRPLGF